MKLFINKYFTKSEYWLTRWVFLRFLGIVYFFAFLSLALQVIPLIGSDGLLPADQFLDKINQGSLYDSFTTLPTLFWFYISDNFLLMLAWAGCIISLLMIFGYANVPMLLFQWIVYMSFVHIGQTWYGYGWEIQLLETGFLAMFFVPFLEWKSFPKLPPPKQVVWLLRWLTFRINIGAGMIKIRGDSCWRKLTCLIYHYETQPIPNPLSAILHFLPAWFHKIGVGITHFVQLVVPWFVWLPRYFRHIAGGILLLFQITLFVSGNLSFLNLVTMIAIIRMQQALYLGNQAMLEVS